jgi:hypothetical protein
MNSILHKHYGYQQYLHQQATVLTGFLKLPAAGLKGNGSVGSEVALWTKTKGASDEYGFYQANFCLRVR